MSDRPEPNMDDPTTLTPGERLDGIIDFAAGYAEGFLEQAIELALRDGASKEDMMLLVDDAQDDAEWLQRATGDQYTVDALQSLFNSIKEARKQVQKMPNDKKEKTVISA